MNRLVRATSAYASALRAYLQEFCGLDNRPVSYLRDVQNSSEQTTICAHVEGFYESPLADSNRRPPPYHGGLGAVLAGTADTRDRVFPANRYLAACRPYRRVSARVGACPSLCTRLVPAPCCLFSKRAAHSWDGVPRGAPGSSGRLERSRATFDLQRCVRLSEPVARRHRLSVAHQPRNRPASWASTTAWTRSRSLSFWRRCVMCVLTVASLM